MVNNFKMFNLDIRGLDINTLIWSLLAVVAMYLIFTMVTTFIKWKFKTEKLNTSLVFILIAVSIKIIFTMNKTNVDVKIINTGIYLAVALSIVKILDFFANELIIQKKNIKIPQLIHNVIIGVVYFITFFTVLKFELGIDLGPLLTTSAVISMVVGLSLQNTLTDFIGGIVLHIEKPFKIDNWIKAEDTEGKVVEINWRTTKLLTFDGDILVVPNSNIVKFSIINYSYPTPKHFLSLFIGASYDSPPNMVKEAILEVVRKNTNIIEPEMSQVRVINYNDFSIDYEIKVFINDYGRRKVIADEVMTSIWYLFKRNDIKIPFPVRDIYHHNVNDKAIGITDENFTILKEVEFFKGFSDTILQDISKVIKRKLYGKGETLFSAGDKGDSFFITYNGIVAVLIKEEEVARLGKGSFFGEMSLFTGKDRNATIKAIDDSEFLILDKDSFSRIISQNIEIAEKISEIIAAREMQNKMKMEKGNINDAQKNILKHADREKEQKNVLNLIKQFFNI